MVAPSESLASSSRDFQSLKTSLHRQMVEVIDFSKAEVLSETRALDHRAATCLLIEEQSLTGERRNE